MKTKSAWFKNNIIYILFFLLAFNILINTSCKKSTNHSDNKKQSNVETNANIEEKETMSCLTLKDYSEIYKNNKTDYKYSSINGEDKDALEKNSYSFYSEYWRKTITGFENVDKTDFKYENIVKIKEIIDNPKIDVKIKSINNNIAIISRSSFGNDWGDDLLKVEDLWVYRLDKWEIIHDLENNIGRSVKLIDLNDDEYIDALVTGGCCDSSEINILIGDQNEVLIFQQTVEITGLYDFEYKGKCNSKFYVEPYDAMIESYASKPKLAIFDCRLNKYIFQEIR